MDTFFHEDNELLEKNNDKKELECKPIYQKQILKTKIKPYGDEATGFYNKQMLKTGSNKQY